MALEFLCKACGDVKPIYDFPRNKRNKNGMHSYCFVCHRAKNRMNYEKKKKKEGGVVRKHTRNLSVEELQQLSNELKSKESTNDQSNELYRRDSDSDG